MQAVSEMKIKTTTSFGYIGYHLLIAIFIFFISGLFTSSQIYWGESSLLTTRAWYLGGSHPPGYSSFLQMLWLFQHGLVFGDIASRSNHINSVFLAGIAVLLFHVLNKLHIAKPISFISTSVGCASLSIIRSVAAVEVYAVHLFFVCLLLLFLFFDHQQSSRHLWLLCFLSGIFLTHHLTIILLYPGLIVAIQYPRKNVRSNVMMLALLFFIFGSSVLLYLPVRESVAPLNVWGNPDQVQGFYDLITAREEASGSFLAGIRSWRDITSRSLHCLSIITDTFQWIGLPFVILGAFKCWKQHIRFAMFSWISFVILFLAVSLYASNESTSFFLPALILCVIWFAFGIQHSFYYVSILFRNHRMVWRYLERVVLLFFLSVPLSQSWKQGSHDVMLPRLLGIDFMDRAEPEAPMITRRSDISFILAYLRDIEKRSSHPVIFQHLLSFKWYYQDLLQTDDTLADPRLLEMAFEDSWEWNRAVTASIIQRNRHRTIMILDPEIISDIQHAGVTDIALRPDGFGAELGPSGSASSHQSSLPFRLNGRFDPISAQQLAGHYTMQSQFCSMIGDTPQAQHAQEKARSVWNIGRQLGWW